MCSRQGSSGAISTGQAGKYSPINQMRARRRGFAVPEGTDEAKQKVVAWGQIHPRE